MRGHGGVTSGKFAVAMPMSARISVLRDRWLLNKSYLFSTQTSPGATSGPYIYREYQKYALHFPSSVRHGVPIYRIGGFRVLREARGVAAQACVFELEELIADAPFAMGR